MTHKKDHPSESSKRNAAQRQPEPQAEPAVLIPPEVAAELEGLRARLAEVESLEAEYKEGWQRAVADFQNYKRRVDGEAAETYQLALATVVRRYLPILDDLERALAHRPQELAWVDGIELIFRKLQTILENEGVKRMQAEGQPFDPNFHEAVAQEAVEGVESGTVTGVIQPGYMLGERVIRPAMVRVAQ